MSILDVMVLIWHLNINPHLSHLSFFQSSHFPLKVEPQSENWDWSFEISLFTLDSPV